MQKDQNADSAIVDDDVADRRVEYFIGTLKNIRYYDRVLTGNF